MRYLQTIEVLRRLIRDKDFKEILTNNDITLMLERFEKGLPYDNDHIETLTASTNIADNVIVELDNLVNVIEEAYLEYLHSTIKKPLDLELSADKYKMINKAISRVNNVRHTSVLTKLLNSVVVSKSTHLDIMSDDISKLNKRVIRMIESIGLVDTSIDFIKLNSLHVSGIMGAKDMLMSNLTIDAILSNVECKNGHKPISTILDFISLKGLDSIEYSIDELSRAINADKANLYNVINDIDINVLEDYVCIIKDVESIMRSMDEYANRIYNMSLVIVDVLRKVR